MSDITSLEVKDTTANPAPLGLFGFGMTTVLLNIHNAGIYEMSSMILAMGIFYGGLAQIIAGIMEWKKKNTFGTVAFTSYGLFWMTLVALIVMPKLGWIGSTSTRGMVCYLTLWGVFTFLLFIGTLRINRALQFVFLSLTLLFFFLAIGDVTGNAAFKCFTGWEGVICGASAMYAAIAQVLNEVYGKTVLPICPVKQ